MTDRSTRVDHAGLETALRDLAGAIDWPTATPTGGPDLAMRVRVRLGERPRRPGLVWPALRWRRSLLLALTALLALAAIAAAVGLGLPGLRLTLGEPPATPPPSVRPGVTAPPGPLGAALSLGDPVRLDQVEALTGLPPRLPGDPAIGPPDAVYVDRSRNRQVAYVWGASDALPATTEPGIGLILMRFDGQPGNGLFEKLLGQGVSA
ncbi:MAG TPA: hypothetical protein VM408_03280, partial [Methylomirabilota bacterium]|nr:hypothetical protein [Methylomirabilota bacterium]